MAIADHFGLPIAAGIASASPHEVTLVDETIDNGFLDRAPDRLIGDRAYDSDGLGERLWEERGNELALWSPVAAMPAPAGRRSK